MFGIFAALAGYERELIRERTVAGLKAAHRQRFDGPQVQCRAHPRQRPCIRRVRLGLLAHRLGEPSCMGRALTRAKGSVPERASSTSWCHGPVDS